MLQQLAHTDPELTMTRHLVQQFTRMVREYRGRYLDASLFKATDCAAFDNDPTEALHVDATGTDAEHQPSSMCQGAVHAPQHGAQVVHNRRGGVSGVLPTC